MNVMRLTCKTGAKFFIVANTVSEALLSLPAHNKDVIEIYDVSQDSPVIVAGAAPLLKSVSAQTLPPIGGGDFHTVECHDGAEAIGSDELVRLAKERDSNQGIPHIGHKPDVLGNVVCCTPETAPKEEIDPVEELARGEG